MEYFSINHNLDFLEKLVKSELTSNNKENRDWARIYKLVLSFLRKDQPMTDLLDQLEAYSPSYKIPCIAKKLLSMYINYRLGYYRPLFSTAIRLEQELNEIKNPLVKEFYVARYSEVLSNAYLFVKADVKKARFYANNVINSPVICARFKYNTYYIVGISYLFESYRDFNKYMSIYLDYARQFGRESQINYVENNDLPWAKIYWEEEVLNLDQVGILEKAYYYVKRGDNQKAKELLAKYENKSDPFYLCYKGIVENSPNMLIDSMLKFKNNGNTFFAQLPLSILKNSKEFKETAEIIFNNLQIA